MKCVILDAGCTNELRLKVNLGPCTDGMQAEKVSLPEGSFVITAPYNDPLSSESVPYTRVIRLGQCTLPEAQNWEWEIVRQPQPHEPYKITS
jgi:hypothetical protein